MAGPNRPEAQKIYSQVQGPGMRPVYSGVNRNGEQFGFLGYEQDPSQGVVDVPKPDAILAEQARLGGKELEPIYAERTLSRGQGGASETVAYGPPIGYRYDNGQSQYVNFDAGGQYQGTQDRQHGLQGFEPLLAMAAAGLLGPLAFEALGLTGAGAGGAGLLADTAALGAGQVAATAPLAFTPEMIAAGTFTPGSIGAYGASQGLLNAAQLAAAGGLVTQGATPALVEMAAQGGQDYINSGGSQLSGTSGPNGTDIFREIATPPPPPQLTPAAIESGLGTPGYGANASAIESGLFNPELIGAGAAIGAPLTLPSWATVPNSLLAASALSSVAKANETTPTAAPFTMAPYVPPSGKPFANLGMSPIATPYTPTRILGQYDPTMTPGGVSPYELIMAQMQAPKNLYADFEAGTNIGGFDPQRFVVPPAAAAAALPNNMGGMIDKSRMVGPDPMGPDNGFASIQDGEFVMNRKATQKYGIELMNAINSGKISKGKLSGLLEA